MYKEKTDDGYVIRWGDQKVSQIGDIMKKKKPEGYNKGLRRKENLTIEEVYNAVKDVLFEPEDKKAMAVINGDKIKGNSQRFQTFWKRKGL